MSLAFEESIPKLCKWEYPTIPQRIAMNHAKHVAYMSEVLRERIETQSAAGEVVIVIVNAPARMPELGENE